MASAPPMPSVPSRQIHPWREHSLVPGGMATILPEAAYHVRRLESQLLTHVSQWGYDEIILPTFEYLDVLAPGLESFGRQDVRAAAYHRGCGARGRNGGP